MPAARDRSVAASIDHREAFVRLGRLVRDQRRKLGLTLRDVSGRSGLSSPFLSQVENGVASPSLSSLLVLAGALETTPEALLAGPAVNDSYVVARDRGLRYLLDDTSTEAVRYQLTDPSEPFSAAEYVVEPGADLGGFHASAGRDLVHVVAGRLVVEVRSGDTLRREVLRAGDTMVYPTSDEHRWSVEGRTTTRFVLISAEQR